METDGKTLEELLAIVVEKTDEANLCAERAQGNHDHGRKDQLLNEIAFAQEALSEADEALDAARTRAHELQRS